LKIIINLVDRDGGTASVVLPSAGDEGLGEKEPGQPKHVGRIVCDPLLKEFNSGHQIIHPPPQWFQGRVPAKKKNIEKKSES
jgi:hypothetical protein